MRWHFTWIYYLPYLLIVLVGCNTIGGAAENNNGVSFYERAEYNQALQLFQSAQVEAYNQADYYFNAGNAYVKIGDAQRAIDAFTQALKTADTSVQAQIYYNFGNLYYSGQRYDDAIAAYREALLRNPDDDDARHNLELALQHALPSPTPPPSPTPEAQDAVTPTPQNMEGPTPTSETSSPEQSTQQEENALSVEDAQRLLDGVQQSQQSIQQYLQPPEPPSPGKDW